MKLMRFNFEELIKIADQVSVNSKDQSTKVGAVFINKLTGLPIAYGYNGMPRGLNDNHIERNIRPEKYKWIEHAERNTIYNVARETLMNSRILTLMIPNMESARAIVSSGIKEVVCLDNYQLLNTVKYVKDGDFVDSPEKEFNRVLTLFENCHINFKIIKANETLSYEDEKLRNHLKILFQTAKALSTSSVKDAAIIYKEGSTTPINNAFGVSEYFDLGAVKHDGYELEYDKSELELESVKAAIFNHVKDKFNDCMGLVTWCPCIKCSVAMLKVGVKEIYTRQLVLSDENDQRWEKSFRLSQSLLPQMGILLGLLPLKKVSPQEFKQGLLSDNQDFFNTQELKKNLK